PQTGALQLISILPVPGFLTLLLVMARHRVRELAERPSDLARDDPDLVGLALRDLWQNLKVLVGEQLRVGVALVNRAEDRVDCLCLAFGLQDRCLSLPLRPQNRALLLSLCGENL